MSDKQKAALAALIAAVVVGAIAQAVAKQEATILGLSTIELAVVGFVIGRVATRTLSR